MKEIVIKDPEGGGRGGWQDLDTQLVEAFRKGCAKQGIKVRTVKKIERVTDYEAMAIIGVRNGPLIKECQKYSIPFVYFDKAYNRQRSWWKISYNAHHPTKHLMEIARPDDRSIEQGWGCWPWRNTTEKGHILLAGSSLKYHLLYGLQEPTEYWTSIVNYLKEYNRAREEAGKPRRTILYRPKKSWKEAVAIPGTEFSKKNRIIDDLQGAHVMITHGSNSCFEALCGGTPTIVLGDGITKPISSTTLGDLDTPYEATGEQRSKLLDNLAYFQWSVKEVEESRFYATMAECMSL